MRDHRLALDALTVRVAACEQTSGAIEEVTALKTDITELRKDVDYLKSTDMSMLFGTMEILDMPSVDIPICSDVPPATTEDETKTDDAVADSKAEMDEEQFDVREEAVYNDLIDLEGAMFETMRHASLQDTSMMGFSGAKDAEISGINAQTEGAVDMQTLPQA
ncbi:hypothetical protein R3W88_007915 [Solanum pinnatisectum]|uniref:Polyprotein protein n=1 Tax=Solanum pinnatisectum TaxID=50273 RepID=A0AAV9M9R0_9SOLN|nr:hypothetical protein R3W88_007915 [Solanum pinnatisectum]